MSIPVLEGALSHYRDIPKYTIGKKVLDIGSSNGEAAFKSGKFHGCMYLGIDCQIFETLYMPVVQADLFDFEPCDTYDTILFLHVLEHVPLVYWENILSKYAGFLNPNGHIVVNVPYKDHSLGGAGYMKHVVLNIDEALLKGVWKFDSFKYGLSPVKFRANGESLFRAVLRAFYRIITRHPYSLLERKRVNLIAIWRNTF